MSIENIILLACMLVLIQIFIPIVIEQLIFKKINFSFLFSSRDEIIESSIYGYRSKRALNNLLETLPIFSLLVILSIFKEIDNSSLAAFWLILRAFYIPIYILGINYVRTFKRFGATTCLVMMGINFI